MPKIQVIETTKLPTGTARFQDTIPALKEAYLAKVTAGKVVHTPNYSSIVNHGDGYTTITTTSVWNNSSDLEEFKNFVHSNYSAARAEYYHSVCKGHEGKNVGTIYTETEID